MKTMAQTAFGFEEYLLTSGNYAAVYPDGSVLIHCPNQEIICADCDKLVVSDRIHSGYSVCIKCFHLRPDNSGLGGTNDPRPWRVPFGNDYYVKITKRRARQTILFALGVGTALILMTWGFYTVIETNRARELRKSVK